MEKKRGSTFNILEITPVAFKTITIRMNNRLISISVNECDS